MKLSRLKFLDSFLDRISRFLSASAVLMLSLPRWLRRGILVLVDVQLCFLATWSAFYLRIDDWVTFDRLTEPAVLSVVIALPIFFLTGLYRIILRYSTWPAFRAVLNALVIYTAFYLPIVMIITLEDVPRTVGILQPLILFFFVIASRLLAGLWLSGSYLSRLNRLKLPRAVIYGGGGAGQQLATALSHEREMRVVAFIDDDPRLANRVINGIKIYPPDVLDEMIRKLGFTHIFLAMPSISRLRRAQIVNLLSHRQLVVRSLPSFADIVGGRITVSDIRELEIIDLLGREPVESNPRLLQTTINGKTVLVTGAGGSIGSELCRQIISFNPKVLLMVEFSEYALYQIHAELDGYSFYSESESAPQIVPILCSVQDKVTLRQIFISWKPDTVYHAAAFKHVPLVECNILEAFKNNVFGTLNIALLAVEMNVSNMILISTDKAVRPTNVMGATKRVAEMILQALSQKKQCKTRLSMVRFGNVLGSSGSVIPKFQEQIRMGGPVTVTHPEVTRYFMTIPEAAELVLQAASLAKGGEVFLLDMGSPVKILDLARRMISLSGLSERSLDNPEGDIEVRFIGLRPGEKMYEELLIGENAEKTIHSRIMQANESLLSWSVLNTFIARSMKFVEASDVNGLLEILDALVDGFERQVRSTNKIDRGT
jgi:FlaA1/EpsC-like NDP-sugar epimerase